jgi:proline iminopeptidase
MKAALYPDIEPYDVGMLDVGDGNRLYYEQCGNPNGAAAVVLHGGPGSGCTPRHRRLFDPERYRIVLFDQRNSGRSVPHASDPDTSLAANTTPHLVADIERLRTALGVDRWLVYGNSWGSTLALAYAEAHPDVVSAIVLLAVTMSRPQEIEWLYHGAGRFHPEEWTRFRAAVPAHARDGNLVDAYYALMNDRDLEVRERAAAAWCAWEDAAVALDPDTPPSPRYADQRFRLAFARIVTHYFHHRAWLEDDALLRDATRLAAIPGVLVHGRLDLGSPLVNAWELARAWPAGELVVVGAGHLNTDHGMSEAVVAATDRFAGRPVR